MNSTQAASQAAGATAQAAADTGKEAGTFADAALSTVSGGDSLFLWSNYLEAIALLCFLLAGLWLFLWLIRRRYYGGLAGPIPTMVIESRLALAPKKWVVITRFMDKRLILGMTDQHITLLSEMPLEQSEEPEKKGTSRFASMLSAAVQDKKAQNQENAEF